MTLRAVSGHTVSETVDDLNPWLHGLEGCPTVHRVVVATCERPAHDEPATWFYVESDRAEGVARLRCLGCGHTKPVLDSEERWTYPPAWSCGNCRQSIAEVAFGLNLDRGDGVRWMAMGVRCVNCGELAGVADFVVDGVPVEEAVTSPS